ncbi:MAG TPA: BadF/BadG/BcrA/BcrD ATPase family protein, partial [Burkholderiaceae bacterium]
VEAAMAHAFANAAKAPPPRARIALGLGLAGVHNRAWARQFVEANPGYGAVVLETDAYTTLLGAHGGAPGAIVAIGTGSVGEAMLTDGARREVGGWGFPAGDEAGGAWIGLRAISHLQQCLDGRQPNSAFAQALLNFCGGTRETLFAWLAKASQTNFAQLAPIVLEYAPRDACALALVTEAGRETAKIAQALDPSGTLPIALCGGLGLSLRPYLPAQLLARVSPPAGDAAAGALLLIRKHLEQNAN